jgi:hypothetical protein
MTIPLHFQERPNICRLTNVPSNRERARHPWLMPVILATQEAENRRIAVLSQCRKKVHQTLSLKHPTQNRAGRVTHMVESLPRKCEAMSSNSSAAKKKKNSFQNITKSALHFWKPTSTLTVSIFIHKFVYPDLTQNF